MTRLQIFSAMLLAAASAWVTADVAVVASVDETVCEKVATEICETHKKDAEKKCHKWHREKAEELGGNRVVMTDSSYSESKRPMFDGRFKTIRNTSITADYFACATAVAEEKAEMSGETVEAVNQSIEQRLKTLQNLLDKGLITEQEYQAKREEILSEL